jgi:magnesium transporter
MLNELFGPDLEVLIKENKYDDVVNFLTNHHPAEAAEMLSSIEPEQIRKILIRLEPKTAADVFCELTDMQQSETAQVLSREELTSLLEKMPPDERADLAKGLSEEQLDEVLPFLAQKERDDIKKLVAWPEGTAGSVMTTDYIAFPEVLTVKQAVERIRLEGAQKAAVSTIYILDMNRRLCGYLTLEDLILAKPLISLGEAKKKPLAEVTAGADREEAVYKISKYNLMMLPVVDDNGMLIGIITHDDIIDVIEEERTEDMERFMAISGRHEDSTYLQTPVFTQFKRRVVWLVILAAAGLISGAVLQSYEATISQLMLLTFYMPMLADTGGNTGSQSATVVVRALALKEIKPKDAFKVIWKEFRIALLLGIVLGVLAFLRVWMTAGGSALPVGITLRQIGFVIGLALFVQVVSATIIGAVLPLLAAVLKLDPALIASPALTTIVDITGLFIYFSFAHSLLGV